MPVGYLCRVDLSQVVSKYIGETEKNLALLLDRPAHSDRILPFDEADARFTQRTDVRDAHDRYANLEFDYRRQQIEVFGRAALLTTNLKRNLDQASETRPPTPS